MKLRVLILGYGEMGHAMEYLLANNHDVCIWTRSGNVSLEDEAGKAEVILFCLPVNAHHEICLRIAPIISADNLCLSIAKGLDEKGMTASQVFTSVFSTQCRYGVVYGPMISEEILRDRYAFADVGLSDPDDFNTVRILFCGTKLICDQTDDMLGSSWSVILKNVYAIIFGIADELKLGDNMRGYLIVRALAELSDISKAFGANGNTPYSYAGLGDLLKTATSENSHHHEVGRKLARGDFSDIAGEGVHTLAMIDKYHLFDRSPYPLFTLIQEIISKPGGLNQLLEDYLRKSKEW